MISTASARCLPAGNLPVMGRIGRCSWRDSTSRIRPGSRRPSALNIESISADVRLGLNSSTSAS
jgi:hypothetical protein